MPPHSPPLPPLSCDVATVEPTTEWSAARLAKWTDHFYALPPRLRPRRDAARCARVRERVRIVGCPSRDLSRIRDPSCAQDAGVVGCATDRARTRLPDCDHGYACSMPRPSTGDDWFELTASPLPISEVYEWAVRPECGAVVVFSGTVRDHADGRDGVTSLEYEAYAEAVVPVFERIATETRRRHPGAVRVAILHRTGELGLGESSVVVAVSSAHRPVAFDAARFAIDALKESAPIWKKENWSQGSDWGTGAHTLTSPEKLGSDA